LRLTTCAALLAAAAAILAAGSLWAHHSPSAIFDMRARVAVTGTLTKVDWINPHIVVYMDSQSSGKAERWTWESNPPSWYRSVGLARADFAKHLGETVTVEGVRAKDGTLFGYMQKIKLPDGTSYELISAAEPK
jgi:hypothetical protein